MSTAEVVNKLPRGGSRKLMWTTRAQAVALSTELLSTAIDDGYSAVLAMPPSLADVLRDRAQPVSSIMVEVWALLDVVRKLFQFGDGAFVKVGR
jgi:hypothetical protein